MPDGSTALRLFMMSVAILPALIMLLYFWDRGGFRTRAESVWSAVGIGALMAFPVLAVVTLGIEPLMPTAEGYSGGTCSRASSGCRSGGGL